MRAGGVPPPSTGAARGLGGASRWSDAVLVDPRIAQALQQQGGVLARWQALELVPEGVLRGLVRSGALVVVRHGVVADGKAYANADPAGRAVLEVRAEQAVRRRCEVATGLTAAAVHGLPILGTPPQRARLSLPREVGERPREDRPRSWLPDEHLTTSGGVVVTTLARTVVDVARTRPFAFAVVTADAALARGCREEELEEVLSRCRRFPGTRSARRAIAFADARSESALESLGRARFDEHGLPPPALQVDLGDEYGAVRVDHYWEEHRTVGEADGLAKYDDLSVLRAEKVREDGLRDRGEQVVRYGWDEALRHPAVLAARFRRAFMRTARSAG